jgi:hypothetical protein
MEEVNVNMDNVSVLMDLMVMHAKLMRRRMPRRIK